MPWLETVPVEERERFIADDRLGLYTRTELCARYQVSRKTGYKWLGRMAEGGRAALRDLSRAPHRCPHRIAAEVAERICAARRAHPSWGPGMLLQWLARQAPDEDWPAPSTAGDLLARRGLVKKRRRRRPHYHPGVVAPVTHAPNDLWTADFKGHFRTRDGVYCYPLTIADQHTRYLLTCQGLLSTKGDGVRASFERRLPCPWPAARDSHRQRGAVCDHWHPRPLPAQRLVDAARHPAPTQVFVTAGCYHAGVGADSAVAGCEKVVGCGARSQLRHDRHARRMAILARTGPCAATGPQGLARG